MTDTTANVFDVANEIDASIIAVIGKIRSQIPPSREASLVTMKLQEALFWLSALPLS